MWFLIDTVIGFVICQPAFQSESAIVQSGNFVNNRNQLSM